jgi:small-conductance mechanosensitive channel
MKDYRRIIGKLVVALMLVTSFGVSVASATEGDPNAAGSSPMDLSELDVGTVQEVLNRIYTYLAEYGLKIVGAVLIFLVGRWVAKLLSRLGGKAMTKAKMDPTLVHFVQDLCYVGMLTFVIIAVLAKLGIQTASFIAVLGAAGLAVGSAFSRPY